MQETYYRGGGRVLNSCYNDMGLLKNQGLNIMVSTSMFPGMLYSELHSNQQRKLMAVLPSDQFGMKS